MATFSGTNSNELINGTTETDNIAGRGGNDSINSNDGNDTVFGDFRTAAAASGISGPGQYNLLVWDLSDINISGVVKDPFKDGDVTGQHTKKIAGGTLSIDINATPVTVGVNDNDSYFNDGDHDQVLASNETINGRVEDAGDRFTPEYAYTIQNTATGEIITIYAVEFGSNKMVGFVSDAPLQIGADYVFVKNVDTCPSISYENIASTYLNADGSSNIVLGDDVINGGAGDDVIFGDNGFDTNTAEVAVDTSNGDYTLAVWDLSDVFVSGVSDYPFEDGDVTGEPTHEIAGGILLISADSTPVSVGVNDNDSYFNDGDHNQVLASNETINGRVEGAGHRFTPEYAYIIQNTATGEIITIYAVEFGSNKMVGFVSDAPLQAGVEYTFIARVDTHPSVSYSDLADTYLTDGTGIIPDDGEGGNDIITGGEGADTMYGQGGDDTFIVSSANEGQGDTVVGGNGPSQYLDNDTLDLRGAGAVTIDASADASDAGAQAGTVTFANGDTLRFSQIETILKDTPNQAPTAVDDALNGVEDTALVTPFADLLANDTDPENQPLSIVSVQNAVNGTVEIINGNVVFTPDANYNGPASYTYTMTDGMNEASATVNLSIAPVNDAPIANDDFLGEFVEGQPIAIDVAQVLSNDSDPDGDAIRANAVMSTVGGSFAMVNDVATFIPEPGFVGDAKLTYQITDDNGGTDTATITFKIVPDTNVNQAPIAADDDLGQFDMNTPAAIDVAKVLSNDVDPDGDTLTATAVIATENGQFAFINGVPSFVPDAGFTGTASLTYQVDDGNGGSDTATVFFEFVDPNANNQAPVANDDTLDGASGTNDVVIDPAVLLANDTDPNPGDVIKIQSVGNPVNGTVALDPATGNVIFSPTADYCGAASFTYVIVDEGGLTSEATVNLTITDSMITGSDADEVLEGTSGNDIMFGYGGEDNIQGNDGDDCVFGGYGNDLIAGGNGNDSLNGDRGNDTLKGGNGDDRLQGGQGNDALSGGAGVDTFAWAYNDIQANGNGREVDHITDFNSADDRLDLADLLHNEQNSDSLDHYLDFHFDESTGDTTVAVSALGSFEKSDDSGTCQELGDQLIVLDGVDLTAGNTIADENIIQYLMNNNQLIVDM